MRPVANSSLHLLARGDIQLAKRLLIERGGYQLMPIICFVNPTTQDITVPVTFFPHAAAVI